MTDPADDGGVAAGSRWRDAAMAAALMAVDPAGLGGVSLRVLAGPLRDMWLERLRSLIPAGDPWRRMPAAITDERLLGGLDLAATLRAGSPIGQRGLLAESDGGFVLVAMAERLPPATAARLVAAADAGVVSVARDGLDLEFPARIGLVALDEGMSPDERPPEALLDRLAFHLDLDGISARDAVLAEDDDVFDRDAIRAARSRLARVMADDAVIEALCDTAAALGAGSLRAPILALHAARAAAALDGREKVEMTDAALASRLVLAPRATLIPAPPGEPPPPETEEPPEPPEGQPAEDPPSEEAQNDDEPIDPRALGDILLEAARAALPPGLLDRLRAQHANRMRAQTAGRFGAAQSAIRRGRPAGTRAGDPGGGARLNVIETLRAAAPWQLLRQRAGGRRAATRLEIRREDFRITRLQQRAGATSIFVVDASGSSAANRLAEAKGAVELLLADCYVRRDHVAVIAFRGSGAQILLPPTRSLVRAKRSLAGLPGGGGTPLASGLDAAFDLAGAVRRRGETPAIVVLTDGRANVARDGTGGRAQAASDAHAAARQHRAAGFLSVVIDTSSRPQPDAARLAVEMGARYLPLPYASAAALSRTVRAATGQPETGRGASPA